MLNGCGVPAAWDRRRGPAVLLLALLMAMPPHLRAQEAPEVRSVRFTGAYSVPKAELVNAVATRASRCRSMLFSLFCRFGLEWARDKRYLPDSAQVRLDAERIATLYEAWGHPGTPVERRVDRRGDQVRVEFMIRETPPLLVESIEIRGLDTIRPAVRLEGLPLEVGKPYALPRVRAAERVVQAQLAEQGRPYATVTLGGNVDEARRRVAVILDIAPGRIAVFGEPRVRVAPPIREGVVRERLAFTPGEPFRTSALERTERALYALPIVARAVAAAVTTERDAAITADVFVETRRRRAIEVEGTVSSIDCLELGSFWRDRYFLGGPRVLALGVSFSNLLAAETAGNFPCTSAGRGVYGRPNYRLQAELWQPWFGDARTTLLLRGSAHRESSPAVYVQDGFGGEIAIGREIVEGANLQLGYAPERHSLDAVSLYFCGNYGLCTVAETAQFRAAAWLAPVQLVGTWSTAGAGVTARPPGGPLEFAQRAVPVWRHRVRVATESAGKWSGSSYTYTRVIAEASTTRTLGRNLEMAARVRVGALRGDDVLPPQLRMFSGGVNTVRGTEQNLVGPQVLVLDRDQATNGCAPACNLGTLDPEQVTVRPIGGDRVLETGVEARMWLSDRMQLAAFVDYGRLSRRDRAASAGPRAESLLSPGIGLRVLTNLGPIRLDIGYDGRGPRDYALYQQTSDDDVLRIGTGRLDPFTWDGAAGLRAFARRLQLHVAIGQPF